MDPPKKDIREVVESLRGGRECQRVINNIIKLKMMATVAITDPQ